MLPSVKAVSEYIITTLSDDESGEEQNSSPQNDGDKQEAPDIPQTGDASSFDVWLILLSAAGAVLAGTFFCSRKKKEHA